MASFVFGTPMQMVPSKPVLSLFGGVYQFSVESATRTGAFQYVTATIAPNPKVKILPEVLDTIPDILDVYEFCDTTSIIEFLLSIVFDGAVDPYYTSKEVHIREDRGLILIRARITPDLMCPQAIEPSNSYSIHRFVQRLGKSEFFVSGQEYDFPTQCTQMATITVTHSSLSTNDGWRGFTYPAVDWVVVYKTFVIDMERSLHQTGMYTRADENIITKYVTYATIFETSMTTDQLTVRVVEYPKTIMNTDVAFPANDPDGILIKIPQDGTDPYQYWRQVCANLHHGLIPLVMACDGMVIHDGDEYAYMKLNVEENGVSNAWALHQFHTTRPNAMRLFPEAGISNTVDMTIRVMNSNEYHFSASFYPFLEDMQSLAILNSGNAEYPYVIGILECEFAEDLEDINFLTSVLMNSAGSFLNREFVSDLNRWIGLPELEPWVLINHVAMPNIRCYQVLVKNTPQGIQSSGPNSPSISEPDPKTNESSNGKRKKGWKLW